MATQTLDSIAGEMKPADESTLVEVDITPFTKSETPVILTWRSPDIRKIYIIINDAYRLQRENPNWPEQLPVDVATLAACHFAPPSVGITVGGFYARLTQNPECFSFLLERLNHEYPHLRGIRNREFLDEMVDICVEAYQKHPEDLEGKSSETLEELKKIIERRLAKSTL